MCLSRGWLNDWTCHNIVVINDGWIDDCVTDTGRHQVVNRRRHWLGLVAGRAGAPAQRLGDVRLSDRWRRRRQPNGAVDEDERRPRSSDTVHQRPAVRRAGALPLNSRPRRVRISTDDQPRRCWRRRRLRLWDTEAGQGVGTSHRTR